MQQTEIKNDPLTEVIIGAAIQVHRELRPGLLESPDLPQTSAKEST